MKRLLGIIVLCALCMTACKPVAIEAEVDPKLKDFQAMVSFLQANEVFNAKYLEISGETFAYEAYKMHHIDFTSDGELDTIITVWTQDSEYLPAVFIALEGGEYVNYISDVWAFPEDMFENQEGFVLKKSENAYTEIAAVNNDKDSRFVVNANGSYFLSNIEREVVSGLKMKIKETSSMKLIRGYSEFEVNHKTYFYDENGKEHVTDDYIDYFQYNPKDFQYTYTSQTNVEPCLDETIMQNFIIGANDSLDTFQNVLDTKKSFSATMDYYMKHRANFSKVSREQYIEDTSVYLRSFIFEGMYDIIESVFNEMMHTVTIKCEDPIPAEAKDVFSMVADVYVADGTKFILSDTTMEDSMYYKIACTDLKTANALKALNFDKSILKYEEMQYIDLYGSGYPDAIYTNREDVLAAVRDILYPTIVVKSWSQLKSLENSDLWQTEVLVIPDLVEYLPYWDDGSDV